MRTIDEIIKQYTHWEQEIYTKAEVREMLEEYGKMVVDECREAIEGTDTRNSNELYNIEQQIK